MVTNLSNPDDTYLKPIFARNLERYLLLRKDCQKVPKVAKTLPKRIQLHQNISERHSIASESAYKVTLKCLQSGSFRGHIGRHCTAIGKSGHSLPQM
ncbi:MAG: hypothetical protein OXU23_01770 [Candidatus Poribacteria bacterium]|nr:hypothetical protein [Candidatus Poribacteria bacterium]